MTTIENTITNKCLVNLSALRILVVNFALKFFSLKHDKDIRY